MDGKLGLYKMLFISETKKCNPDSHGSFDVLTALQFKLLELRYFAPLHL